MCVVFTCICCITGEWHTAYILLYGPSRLEIVKEEDGSSAEKKPEGEKVEPMDTQKSDT